MKKSEIPSDRYCDTCGFMTNLEISKCPLCGDTLILFESEVIKK